TGVTFDDATGALAPAVLDAVTSTRTRIPTSAPVSVYEELDEAAPNVVHAPPFESQRCHWYEKVVAPDQVPGEAVTVSPWIGVSLLDTVGGLTFSGTRISQSAVSG